MRRMFVISSMTGGGAARTTANLANHQAACGESVQILTLHQPQRPDVYPLHPSIERRDLGEEAPSAASMSAVLARFMQHYPSPAVIAHAPVIARLRDALLERTCDVAIGIGDVTNIRLLVAARHLPVRVIVAEMADPGGYSILDWELLRRRTYPHAEAVVCLAAEFTEYFRRRGIERVHAIASPVLPAPPRHEKRREQLIVSIGRLAWEKNLPLLLQAFSDVAPRHPEWRLELWGNGPMRRELEGLVASLQLQDRVRLPGVTHDVYELLERAALFAMTSRTEGLPNALCEAMAAGVPAVVADCGAGVRTIVRDGIDGVLVAPRRVAVAGALDALMRDDERRARLASRAPEVVERFAIDRIAAEWDELLISGKVAYAC
ncbi:MAG TPA: glycosyltransferase [Thermoanaerobaculia bacterium]|nr:glycosyltransferase [Thermoanaerobaculia bacterium]